MEEGALDAWLTPILMKKGRPGFTLALMCTAADADRLGALVLRETTTLGLRRSALDRVVLPRREVTVATAFGPMRCKVALPPGGAPRLKPEFEDCRRAAVAHGVPLQAVVQQVLEAAVGLDLDLETPLAP